jgi:hypothetical protein
MRQDRENVTALPNLPPMVYVALQQEASHILGIPAPFYQSVSLNWGFSC